MRDLTRGKSGVPRVTIRILCSGMLAVALFSDPLGQLVISAQSPNPSGPFDWGISFGTQMREVGKSYPFLILGEPASIPIWIRGANRGGELIWVQDPARAFSITAQAAEQDRSAKASLTLQCFDTVAIVAPPESNRPFSIPRVTEFELGADEAFNVECAISRVDGQQFRSALYTVEFTLIAPWPVTTDRVRAWDIEIRPPKTDAERRHVLHHEGAVEIRRKNYAGAVVPLRAALVADPTDMSTAFDLVLALHNLRSASEAVLVLEDTIRARVDRGLEVPVEFRRLLGFQLAVAGRQDAARRTLQEAGASNALVEQELEKARNWREGRR
jgi:hypothetical protein